jgi:hypothetical protein
VLTPRDPQAKAKEEKNKAEQGDKDKMDALASQLNGMWMEELR